MAKENWASLLAVVRNPLAFFALALLVIEGVIGTIAAMKLTDEALLWALVIMAVLFLVLVVLVAVITFWRPGHLLNQVDALTEFIGSDGFHDAVEDAIMELVKDECLQRRKEVSNDATRSV